MKFNIPRWVLYFACGLNAGLFLFGLAMPRYDLSILAILNTMLCLSPILFKNEEK